MRQTRLSGLLLLLPLLLSRMLLTKLLTVRLHRLLLSQNRHRVHMWQLRQVWDYGVRLSWLLSLMLSLWPNVLSWLLLLLLRTLRGTLNCLLPWHVHVDRLRTTNRLLVERTL